MPLVDIKFNKEYFLLLFPLFYVFNRFAENYPLISLPIAGKLFAIYFFAFLVLTLLLSIIYKSWRKASVFTFYIMCWFFLFGFTHDFLKNNFSNTFITKYTFLIPLIAASLIVILTLINRYKKTYNKFVNYANLLFLVLILIDVFKLILINKPTQTKELTSIEYKCDTCAKPDIYLIIADEYAGEEQLNQMFRFNNSFFSNELIERDFHSVNKPISNYNYTSFSIASLLNMDYISNVGIKSNDPKNLNLAFQVIDQNKLIKILSDNDYEMVNHSRFSFAGLPSPIENMFFKPKKTLITAHTLFGRMQRDLWFNLITKFKFENARLKYANTFVEENKVLINKTREIASKHSPQPRFIYTHLIMPHYPYTHDRYGRLRSVDTILGDYYNNHELYKDFLLYSNNQLINLIDQIKKNSPKPPVIMLLGDHGFRGNSHHIDSSYHFSTINYIYLPSMNYNDIPDTLSHVNHFRIFFNKQFNLNLPLLRDTTFFMKEY